MDRIYKYRKRGEREKKRHFAWRITIKFSDTGTARSERASRKIARPDRVPSLHHHRPVIHPRYKNPRKNLVISSTLRARVNLGREAHYSYSAHARAEATANPGHNPPQNLPIGTSLIFEGHSASRGAFAHGRCTSEVSASLTASGIVPGYDTSCIIKCPGLGVYRRSRFFPRSST